MEGVCPDHQNMPERRPQAVSKRSISDPYHARMSLRHCHGSGISLLGLDLMIYRLLFESSAELIRLTDRPNRLATDSGE
jgi:hypothetical protein